MFQIFESFRRNFNYQTLFEKYLDFVGICLFVIEEQTSQNSKYKIVSILNIKYICYYMFFWSVKFLFHFTNKLIKNSFIFKIAGLEPIPKHYFEFCRAEIFTMQRTYRVLLKIKFMATILKNAKSSQTVTSDEGVGRSQVAYYLLY